MKVYNALALFAVLGLTILGCAEGKNPPSVTSMLLVDELAFNLGSGAVNEQCVGGAPKDSCGDDIPQITYPTWPVIVPAFELDEHEVTNVQFQHCVAHGVCTDPRFVNALGGGAYDKYYDEDDSRFADYPVINITYDQAKTYCEWVGKRLPTAFEWEAASRHFAQKTQGQASRFMFGDEVDDCEGMQIAMAGCNGDLDTPQLAKDSTESQDAFSDDNGNVIYGLVGNVSEWTSTYYQEDMHCDEEMSAFKKDNGDACVSAYVACAGEEGPAFRVCAEGVTACGDCRDESDITADIDSACYGICLDTESQSKWICKQHVEPVPDPNGPAVGSGRAIRGGNYQTGGDQIQTPIAYDMCHARMGAHVGLISGDDDVHPTLGFRCARDI